MKTDRCCGDGDFLPTTEVSTKSTNANHHVRPLPHIDARVHAHQYPVTVGQEEVDRVRILIGVVLVEDRYPTSPNDATPHNVPLMLVVSDVSSPLRVR